MNEDNDEKRRDSRTDAPSGKMPDEFDRLLGALDKLPDVTQTRPHSINAMPLMGVGGSTTFIMQTLLQRDSHAEKPKSHYITFLTIASPAGYWRHVLPTEVTDTILRQREALSTKIRKRSAKAQAAVRKAAGWKPTTAHLKGGRKPKKRRAKKT